MRAYEKNIGDAVIYTSVYDVKQAKIVKEPIDGKQRPSFKIGRVDLDNGDYLLSTTEIYDTVEDAENELIKNLEKRLKAKEAEKTLLEGEIMLIKHAASKLINRK